MATFAKTYTPSAGAIQGNLDTLTGNYTTQFKGLAPQAPQPTSNVSSMIANEPAVRQSMGQNLLQNENLLQPLTEERGALIDKLFRADQELSAKYSNQGGDMYIEDPGARERQIGNVTSALYGALGSTNALIKARTTVLGDALDRGMSLYKAGIEAKQYEEALSEKRAQREWEAQQKELDRQAERENILMKQTATQAPTPAALQLYRDIDSSWKKVDLLEQAAKKMPHLGYVIGSAAQKLGMPEWEANTKRVEALKTALALPLARMLAGGSLGQTGGVTFIAEAKKMLPDITDSQEDFDNKMLNLRNIVADNATTLESTYGLKPTFDAYAWASGATGQGMAGVDTTQQAPINLEEQL